MSFKSQTPLNIAEAKRRFSEIVNEVLYHDKQFVIARHGKPVVGIVPASFIPSKINLPKSGFLALVGLWEEVKEIDKMVKNIYKKRKKDLARPVPSLER